MLTFVLLLLTWPGGLQAPLIGIIDFYGLRGVSEGQVREALQITEGDAMPDSSEAARRRLEALPGVATAHIQAVCCDARRLILYVGIEEKGTPSLEFRPAPRGTIRLPGDVLKAGEAFEKALVAAVERGDAGEDDSKGHALMHDPAARAIQEQFFASYIFNGFFSAGLVAASSLGGLVGVLAGGYLGRWLYRE